MQNELNPNSVSVHNYDGAATMSVVCGFKDTFCTSKANYLQVSDLELYIPLPEVGRGQ